MDGLQSVPLVPAALGGVAVYLLGSCAYNLWFHPLRHVPGPWYAAVSPLYLISTDLRLKRAYVIQELLQRYGGIVRIHPNQVAYMDDSASRIVYNKFPKAPIYSAFQTNEGDNSLCTLDNAMHLVRKRAYKPHYVPANLILYEPEIHEFTYDLVAKLRQYGGKKPFDCLILFSRLLTDVTFLTSYGERTGSVKNWDIIDFKEDSASEIIEAIHLFPIRGILRAVTPRPLWEVLIRLPFTLTRKVFGCDAKMAEVVIKSRDQVLARDPSFKFTGEMNDDTSGDERLSLVHRLLRQQIKAKPEDRLTDGDIISEAEAHTIGGVESSSVVLSYIFYVLAQRPDILAQIREELDPLMSGADRHSIPHFATLERLPYLNGFVLESLRLYGSAPSLLERVVPRSLEDDFSIKGYKIPAGTIVGIQAFSVHRDPTIFPDPEAFKPERWIDATEAMRSHLIPFGTGARLCGGFNLVHIVVRCAIAAICRDFDIAIPPETTPESMEQRFAFAAMPKARRAHLIFKPRA